MTKPLRGAGLTDEAPWAEAWSKAKPSQALKEAAALVEALGGASVPIDHPARQRYLRLLAEEKR